MSTTREHNVAQFNFRKVFEHHRYEEQDEFRIFRQGDRYFVQVPWDQEEPDDIGYFLSRSTAGKIVCYIFRRLGHQRLQALQGSVIETTFGHWPNYTVTVRGGELDGLTF